MIAAAGLKPAAKTVQPQGQGETLAVLGVAPSSGDAVKSAQTTTTTPERRPSKT
ncbi:hypothetical protein [Polymorphobacter arshaanensis]|nr:hypothetical protein [Polymorphobacter arshaanensis]